MAVAAFAEPLALGDSANQLAVFAPTESPALSKALEGAEEALQSGSFDAAVISGTGTWALGAALACAKGQIPFLYLGQEERDRAYAAHIARLADRVEPAGSADAVLQAWLAEVAG